MPHTVKVLHFPNNDVDKTYLSSIELKFYLSILILFMRLSRKTLVKFMMMRMILMVGREYFTF